MSNPEKSTALEKENETKLATGGVMLAPVIKGEELEECPKGFIAMRCADDRRIATTSGTVYVFKDGRKEFVRVADRDVVAAGGASEVNEAAEAKAKAAAVAQAKVELEAEAKAKAAAAAKTK